MFVIMQTEYWNYFRIETIATNKVFRERGNAEVEVAKLNTRFKQEHGDRHVYADGNAVMEVNPYKILELEEVN